VRSRLTNVSGDRKEKEMENFFLMFGLLLIIVAAGFYIRRISWEFRKAHPERGRKISELHLDSLLFSGTGAMFLSMSAGMSDIAIFTVLAVAISILIFFSKTFFF
jgi:hypothetical protein